jgi:para-aminobenzoate synthetase/4-amino-4-deoxychorismate lyase
MKGTVKRGRTLQEDNALAAWLKASVKNRAENVMIVDMIRNDLGRLAETGSVQVPELFTTERYATLWQMTSGVTAKTRVSFADLVSTLFPCASITGAPKVSTMNIIAALETTPRRLYTGAIGYLAPGRKAQFSVAIRTMLVEQNSGQAEYGVGGGIVWDSTSKDEYAEAFLKARVLTMRQPTFSLLETLRWNPGQGFWLLEEHLRRMEASASYFGLPFNRQKTVTYLQDAGSGLPPAPHRMRLLMDRQGSLSHQVFTLNETNADDRPPIRLKIARQPINSGEVFLYHKTTLREIYETARRDQPDCDDVLLYNERGELTEATIANLVIELDGELLTPPVESGLLAGTFRTQLLDQRKIREKIITRADLARCSQIFLINSVRGWQKAEMQL